MEKEKPLVSVIVPVYNTEKYLRRCIDSLINQTYANIEIIIINDGSVDNSIDICNHYVESDNRVKVYSQKNSGPSVARNYGIKESHGQFITFVDSDDWIDSKMIEVLIDAELNNSSEIAICNYYMTDKFDVSIEKDKEYKIKNYSNPDSIKNLFVNGLYYSHPVAKLFKRELWEGVIFPKGKIYEDLFVIPSVFSRAKSVTYVDYSGYYYYIRSGSILNSKYSERDNDYLTAYEYNINYFSNDLLEIVPYIKSKWCEAFICVYNKILRSKDYESLNPFLVKYHNKFKEYSRKCKTESVNRKYYIMIKTMSFSPKLYNLCIKLFLEKK